jgi:hypothetical protein
MSRKESLFILRIIIISSTAQVGPWPPLLGFRNNNLFYVAELLVQGPTPNLEDQVSVFITPGDRVAQLYPRHWVPILVAFYDKHGLQWDYSLIPATITEYENHTNPINILCGQITHILPRQAVIFWALKISSVHTTRGRAGARSFVPP